jgi:cytochrome c-type biogenesis protein CcmH/NrfG
VEWIGSVLLAVVALAVLYRLTRAGAREEKRRRRALEELEQTRQRVRRSRPDLARGPAADAEPQTDELARRLARDVEADPTRAAGTLRRLMDEERPSRSGR